jgi:hypothetical protein
MEVTAREEVVEDGANPKADEMDSRAAVMDRRFMVKRLL